MKTKLRWAGNNRAQAEYEAAAKKLRDRKPKKHAKKRPAKKVVGKESYQVYLRGAWWKARRKIALKKADWRCDECGTRKRLTVHHLCYKRLGGERDADLVVLCQDCHNRKHPEKSGIQDCGAGAQSTPSNPFYRGSG
jgi:5-methylcytosine-specific restriction endonuclease McrA